MSASASDKFQKVSIATATTLDAPGYTIGDTSITVASTSTWPTDTGITFAIDEVDANGVRVAGSYNEYVGTVASGTSVTNVSHVNGTNRNYTAGTTTRVYIPVSEERENRLVDGILQSHAQDGTIDAQSVANFQDHIDVVDGKAIRDGNNNELLKFSQTASAVNELTVKNAATGNAPQLQATGSDSNIDAAVVPKGTGAVTNGTQKIDWWQELGRTTLGSNGDTITVNNLPARKYLKILIKLLDTGGTIQADLRYNNDSGNNYARRSSANGAADTTLHTQSAHTLTTTLSSDSFIEVTQENTAATEKLGFAISHEQGTAGAANIGTYRRTLIKWANTTDQITRVDIVNGGTGDFATGSEVVVLGHN